MSSPPLSFTRSQELFARAQEIVAGGTTQGKAPNTLIPGEYPIYAARGQGAHLWDVDNNRFLDWILAYGIIVLGYCDPDVDAAAIQEIRQGFAFPLTRPVQNELAELLVEVIPCAEMVHFFKSGSDATTAAVRVARIITGRQKIVRWGYNGWHDWCCIREPGIPRHVREDVLTFRYNDLDSLEEVLKQQRDQVACVIMMPLEIEQPQPGFLAGVKELAHQYGALFILDEMRSGFHVALGGAQEYYQVIPDLATFSKAISNGYAISVLAGRREMMSALSQTYVSSTFYTNSIAMAAAVATINKLRQEEVIPHLWRIGQGLLDGLSRLAEEVGVEAETVGLPPMPFLVFTDADPDVRETARAVFYTEVARQGILLHPNHHWFVSHAHTEQDLAHTLEVSEAAFRLVKKKLGQGYRASSVSKVAVTASTRLDR
ncbi:MAG: aminotransferase class III-fold pyridoxal phosphate-dependent enzyme [Anaerolineales bacterium]|nr:aminotransferase class III-fold pyridoxal phosphate-dependent enzyme [Anaerolineales bacterium]